MFNTLPQLQYTMQMSAQAAKCDTYLNNIKIFSNSHSPTGAFAAGQTLTGYLQNGENDFS